MADPIQHTNGPNVGGLPLGYRAWKEKTQKEDPTASVKRSDYRTATLAGTDNKFGSRFEARYDKFLNNGANSFLSSKGMQSVMGVAGSALDISKGFIPTQESKGKNPTGFEEQQIIGDAMTKVPIPIVQAAGIAYKGISQLAEATGGNVNRITKDDEENWNIGKGNRVFNNIIGTMFPGAG